MEEVDLEGWQDLGCQGGDTGGVYVQGWNEEVDVGFQEEETVRAKAQRREGMGTYQCIRLSNWLQLKVPGGKIGKDAFTWNL